MKSKVPEVLDDAYGNAVIGAIGETDLPEETFPAACPWSFDEILSAEFWPGGN